LNAALRSPPKGEENRSVLGYLPYEESTGPWQPVEGQHLSNELRAEVEARILAGEPPSEVIEDIRQRMGLRR